MASMAAGFHDDVELGFEEGMLWLPSHVLNEACDDIKVYNRNWVQNVQNHHHQIHYQHHNHNLSREPQPKYSSSNKYSTRSSKKYYDQREKVVGNGGNGMQAIFLESRQRTCGTGVFLPQKAATNNSHSTKKPACAPVLLPARVVQALNLNVHALGLQISPPQVHKYNPRCGEFYNNNNKMSSTKKKSDEKDASQNQDSSPEIFLPKEWTY